MPKGTRDFRRPNDSGFWRSVSTISTGWDRRGWQRSAALLGPEATVAMRRTVVEIMARIRPAGYAQAAHMLSTGDITADLAVLPTGLRIQILVGEADVITPPAINLEIAAALPTASVRVIAGAGHALYLEKPAEFDQLIADFAASATIASSA